MTTEMYVKEVRKATRARGSLLFVESLPGVRYGEVVEITLESGIAVVLSVVG